MSVTTRPSARAAGAAGAVQVRLVLVGRVGLDHQIDVVDVDAARRDIRRHQHVDAARGEPLEVARALGLVEVAVQRERRDAGVVELLGEHLGVRAGAGEDEGLALAVDEADRGSRPCRGGRSRACGGRSCWSPGLRRRPRRRPARRGTRRRARRPRGRASPRRAASGCRPPVWRRMRCTGSRNPSSHMWSASSITATLTSHRSSLRCSMRSSMRPGVPMMMSTPFLSAPTWRRLGHAAVDLRGEQADAAGDRLDRAVDLQRELARRGEDERLRLAAELAALAGLARSTLSTSGAPKAMVLPEPVRPRASTSLPSRIGGIVAAWIGNGAAAPRSASVRTMFSPSPSAPKVTPGRSRPGSPRPAGARGRRRRAAPAPACAGAAAFQSERPAGRCRGGRSSFERGGRSFVRTSGRSSYERAGRSLPYSRRAGRSSFERAGRSSVRTRGTVVVRARGRSLLYGRAGRSSYERAGRSSRTRRDGHRTNAPDGRCRTAGERDARRAGPEPGRIAARRAVVVRTRRSPSRPGFCTARAGRSSYERAGRSLV